MSFRTFERVIDYAMLFFVLYFEFSSYASSLRNPFVLSTILRIEIFVSGLNVISLLKVNWISIVFCSLEDFLCAR